MAVSLFASCGSPLLRPLLEGSNGAAWAGALTLHPASVTLVAGTTVELSATGGDGNYQYSVSAGAGTVDSKGVYTAPLVSGTAAVLVTDTHGSSSETAITIISAGGANPDYQIAAGATFPSSGIGGTGYSGSFQVENIGVDPGTQTITWKVYLSADGALNAGDVVVDSGTQGALGAGSTSASIPFSATWPTAGGSYVLIVEVLASDDSAAGNNSTASGVIPVTGLAPPDYTISGLTITTPVTAGTALSETVTIANNTGGGDGATTVTWEVYLSTDAAFGGGDTLVASGTVGALTAGTSSAPIAVNGTWPAAGTWYLIGRIAAVDDPTSGSYSTASAAVTVTALNVDYQVSAVTSPGTASAGGPLNQTFTVTNIGSQAGTSAVAWNAYASPGNTTAGDPGDILVASGSIGGLGAGANQVINISGNWPAAPGSYYLVVVISSVQDIASANDTASGTAVTVTAPPSPDYTVSFDPAIPWSGIAGTAMNLTGTTQITISNVSANPGQSTISWAVYLSADTVLDAGDTLVQQGTTAALGGGGSTPIAFNGTWPAAAQVFYHLIAVVDAGDDTNLVNDVVPAPHPSVAATFRYVEGAENNGDTGPPPPPLTNVSDTGVTAFTTGQVIAVEAKMDAFNAYDTFMFATGTLGGLSIRAEWVTGFDDLDIYLSDSVGTDLSTIETGIDSEPGGSNFDLTGGGSRTVYVSVNMWLDNNTSGSTGKTYVLLISATP